MVSGAALEGKPIRIVKNLRICKDCHEAFKYISIAIKKVIIVRDVNRYHKFFSVFPRVKVKEQDQDDQQVIKDYKINYVLSLKDVPLLSMLDSCFPVKRHEDVSPMPTARIPKSYLPDVEKYSDSSSEGSEKSKTKAEAEEKEARPNIRVSSTPRPRAVISSPDNDAVIGYKNKIEGRQRTALKNHNMVQNQHTTRTPIFARSPVRTNKSKDDDERNVETKGKKGSRPTVSTRRKHPLSERPSWQDP
ncbi:hypothetical protein V6N13_065190 [Hibiscus sabdariffa]|uniref:DYW domain-containing protein n=1 Tax=Hibiscus sabdariffa TaxID=183260 RepID=A0ABR2QRL0_9ROSI